MKSSRIKLIQSNIGLIVFCVGLVLLLVAQTFTLEWAKIKLDQVLATIGSAIIFSGALQWLFDTFSKPQLFRDIAGHAIRNERLSCSGLDDYYENSKDADYSRTIEFDDDLVVAVNYSPRLLEDYFDEFKRRVSSGRKLTILLLESNSLGHDYAKNGDVMPGHIDPNIKKIESYVHELGRLKPNTVMLTRHKGILKYSFVATKQRVWFTLYCNSLGFAVVPAMNVLPPSKLFDFFWTDIEKLRCNCEVVNESR